MWTKLKDAKTFAMKVPSGLLVKSSVGLVYVPCSEAKADAWLAANKHA